MGQSSSSCCSDRTILTKNFSSAKSEKEVRNFPSYPLSSQDSEKKGRRKDISSCLHQTSLNTNLKSGLTWDPSLDIKDDDVRVDTESNNTKVRNYSYDMSASSQYGRKKQDKLKRVSQRRRHSFRGRNKLGKASSLDAYPPSRIMIIQIDPLHRVMYYFADEKDTRLMKDDSTFVQKSTRSIGSKYDVSKLESSDFDQDFAHQTGTQTVITRLVTKDALEVRNTLTTTLSNKCNKATHSGTILVCGQQIYATRFVLNDDRSKFIKKSNTQGTHYAQENNTLFHSVQDVNNISKEHLREIIRSKKREDQGWQGQNEFLSSSLIQSIPKGQLLSATVKNGIAKQLFDENSILGSNVDPVSQIVCVNKEHYIYVFDIGLSSARCDFIMETSERCSKGSYNAYTYAKQTLGCREFDELAVVCEWPVLRAVATIKEHLEQRVKCNFGEERAPPKNSRKLVLDDREPHIVKYDISRKERQKLDMHTDKSEWTFLIALTEGIGDDYQGGGTYFECIDSTVHLEKGHCLIFPGKLRHRGQKIISGKRFLLVGFLV